MPDLTVTGFIDQFMDADKAMEALGIISRATGIAGEAINIEQPFYVDIVDNKWYKTQATLQEKSVGLLGLAISSATGDGDVITGQFLGLYYSTGIQGTGTLYLSTSLGELSFSPPTGTGYFIRPFGFSAAQSGILIYPDSTYVQIGDLTFPAHASSHTDGTDDIQLASASQKGLMSSGYANIVDNTETGARVLSVNGQTGVVVLDASHLSGIYGGRIDGGSSYTVATLISGSIIKMDGGVVTINSGLGGGEGKFRFDVFNTGTGTCIITGAAGVSINLVSQGGLVLGGQFYGASVFLDTTDSYMIAGGA